MSDKPIAGPRPEHLVALVTGASGGLGRDLAIELDRLGCRVAIHYNSSLAGAQEVQDKLHNESMLVTGDVGDWEAVGRMYQEIRERLGPIDVLVNNAAIRKDALMAMQDPGSWRQVIETNLLGTFYTCRVAIGHMFRQRWGRIINVVSPSGLIATAGQTAYSASKAGVIGLTRTLAAECGQRGVTVNALSPGFMITKMTKDLPSQIGDKIRERAPIPRFGLTDEVARSMGFFLDSDYMTGQVISIDGGVSIM